MARKRRPPQRNRATHAAHLLAALQGVTAADQASARHAIFEGEEILRLEIELPAAYPDALAKLDLRRSGIFLQSARELDGKLIATIRLPRAKLEILAKRIRQYRDELSRFGSPKHQALVTVIDRIGQATINSLWTDDPVRFPGPGVMAWWEIWLEKSPLALIDLRAQAGHLGVQVSQGELTIADRAVVLARCTSDVMADLCLTVGAIAELRLAKELATEFVQMLPQDQRAWVAATLALLTPPDVAAPSVCLLDTGILSAHPLLAIGMRPNGAISLNPGWGADDTVGHGTELGGLALYRDLQSRILSPERKQLSHWLESVKILPPRPEAHSPELYGWVTETAIAQIAAATGARRRIACLAVCSDERDRGSPSSWSAKLDEMASKADSRTLFVVAAGNLPRAGSVYFDSNKIEGIHDPGQSWNSLTIGASTQLGAIQDERFADHAAIAPMGDVAPSSTTSISWNKSWPLKPEVLFEGGNWIKSPAGVIDVCDDVSILTTSRLHPNASFVTTGDTSAAAAQAAAFAAELSAAYPDLWPETIRGLVVHSANWTPAMERHFPHDGSRGSIETRIRSCGFGIPNFERACWSARDAVVLIAQDELQPFTQLRMGEMHFHQLPWPREALLALGGTEILLRATLSYFIEPNPARRGWKKRFRYQSHGLRFEMRKSTESIEAFQKRVNKAYREEDETVADAGGDQGWFLGGPLRSKGSIHSDWWTGTAADLATKDRLAVFPVTGWWKEAPAQTNWMNRVRYSLVLSLESPGVDVDLYSAIKSQIEIPVVV